MSVDNEFDNILEELEEIFNSHSKEDKGIILENLEDIILFWG